MERFFFAIGSHVMFFFSTRPYVSVLLFFFSFFFIGPTIALVVMAGAKWQLIRETFQIGIQLDLDIARLRRRIFERKFIGCDWWQTPDNSPNCFFFTLSRMISRPILNAERICRQTKNIASAMQCLHDDKHLWQLLFFTLRRFLRQATSIRCYRTYKKKLIHKYWTCLHRHNKHLTQL